MASIFTSSIQSHILSLLISRLPLHSIDIPQQSSLKFSGGSGPTLDLHDLELDINKLEAQYFPPNAPFNVRSAFLKHLSIVISRNGIQINLSDINLVVSTKHSSESSQFLDPSSSIFLRGLDDPFEGLEEMMESVVGFVDAVSGVSSFVSGDQANSSVYDDEVNEEDEEEEKGKYEGNQKTNLTLKMDKKDIDLQGQPSTKPQSSIVKYAIDYILGKINVSITNFVITVNTTPLVLKLNFDKITAGGDHEERNCLITGFKISVFDPTINSAENYMKKSTENSTLEKDSLEDEEISQESTDMEFEDAMMSTSFMAASKEDMERSIMESAMYSTGKSVYLSAIEETNIEVSDGLKENSFGSVFFVVDEIAIYLRERQVLSIKVGSIKLSLKEVPILMINFITILIEIDKKSFAQKPKQINTPQKPSNSPILDHFSITEIQIGLNSSLFENQFDMKNSFILYLKNILLERKSSTLMQGSLRTLELINENTTHIYFKDRSPNTNCITMEIQMESNEYSFSVVLKNALQVNVPFELLELIASYSTDIDPFWEKLHEMQALNLKRAKTSLLNRTRGIGLSSLRPSKPKVSKVKTKVTINTSMIHGTLHLTNDSSCSIGVQIAPVVSSSVKDIISIDYIKGEILTLSGPMKLLVNKVRYVDHGWEPERFKDYDINLQKPIISSTKKTVSVDFINCESTCESLNCFRKIIEELQGKFQIKSRSKKHIQFEKSKAVSIMSSSTMFNIKRHLLYLIIMKMELKLTKLNAEFGDLKASLGSLKFTKSLDGDSNISLETIHVQRVDKDLEDMITVVNPLCMLPPVYVRIQNTSHVFLNNLLVIYSGKWLAMFDKPAEMKQSATSGPKPTENIKLRKKLNSDIHISMKDVCLMLKPVSLDSAGVIHLENSGIDILIYDDKSLITQLTTNIVNIFLIDDFSRQKQLDMDNKKFKDMDIPMIWRFKGYVHVGKVMTLLAKLKITPNQHQIEAFKPGQNIPTSIIDIQLDVDSLKVFVCSDSLQCFLQLLKDLKKPIFFSYDEKYKDESNDLDILEDIEPDYFDATQIILSSISNEGNHNNIVEEEVSEELEFVENYYSSNHANESRTVMTNSISPKRAGSSLNTDQFQSSHDKSNASMPAPVSVHVSVARATLNLHDGYDWKETRDQIQNALERVVKKASEVKVLKEAIGDLDAMQNVDIVVEETLFQSVLVELKPNDDPTMVYNHISKNIGGIATEKLKTINLGSGKKPPLILNRSEENKVSIRLADINVDFRLISTDEPRLKEKPDVFCAELNSDDSTKVFQVDLNVAEFQVIDNVSTSSWNMFAGYMREAGEREIGKSMLQLSVEAVRPVDILAAVEMILDVRVLPIRLYVDQDTLDFLSRFFEFKDQRFIPFYGDLEESFIQKLSVDTVKLKLDYKPKVIDYAGLRSGKTGEFVNFFVLDGADIILNRVKLYGISGFSKLNALLNGQWAPDVKKNQLKGVLSGLAPVRSIYNIGYNINSFVTIPIKEYRKEGRVVRGLQLGAASFTKATCSELLKLGAKLAAGTQTILENTEEALGGSGASARVWNRNRRGSSSSDRSGRRRSSAASFGEEGERDYHKYYRNKVILKRNNIDILSDDLEEECAITDDDDEENDNEYNDHDAAADADADADDDADADADDNDDYGGENAGETKSKRRNQPVVSLYANQPASLNEGLRVALDSVQRNMKTATNAVYEASIRASGAETTSGAFIEMAKVTPIIVIRPVIAATEAVSKTLLGGINELNPQEKLKADEKYKPIDDEYISDSD